MFWSLGQTIKDLQLLMKYIDKLPLENTSANSSHQGKEIKISYKNFASSTWNQSTLRNTVKK